MKVDGRGDITTLLNAASAGDQEALSAVYHVVEQELRRKAQNLMAGERAGHTLQATAIANDAFLRLMQSTRPVSWDDRKKFYRLAGRAMGRILTDYANKKNAKKRGGGNRAGPIPADEIPSKRRSNAEAALASALEVLQHKNPRLAEVVELHWFGGYTFGEISALVDRSVNTVKSDWKVARAWLHKELCDA